MEFPSGRYLPNSVGQLVDWIEERTMEKRMNVETVKEEKEEEGEGKGSGLLDTNIFLVFLLIRPYG